MAKLIYDDEGETSREQWILAKVLEYAAVTVDSIFCGDDYTEEQTETIFENIEGKVGKEQIENLHTIVSMWLDTYKDKEYK